MLIDSYGNVFFGAPIRASRRRRSRLSPSSGPGSERIRGLRGRRKRRARFLPESTFFRHEGCRGMFLDVPVSAGTEGLESVRRKHAMEEGVKMEQRDGAPVAFTKMCGQGTISSSSTTWTAHLSGNGRRMPAGGAGGKPASGRTGSSSWRGRAGGFPPPDFQLRRERGGNVRKRFPVRGVLCHGKGDRRAVHGLRNPCGIHRGRGGRAGR
jgi:hypothetical protein